MSALTVEQSDSTHEASAADWYDLGVAQVKAGNIDEALTAFQSVLSAEPENAPAHNGLGICYHFMGCKQEAETAYRYAASLDSRFADCQQRTLMDRLATLYRHKFLRPGMASAAPVVESEEDEDND